MGRMIVSQDDVARLQGLLQTALQGTGGPQDGPPSPAVGAVPPGVATPPAAASPGPPPKDAIKPAEMETYVAKILPFLKGLLDMQPPTAATPGASAALPPLPGPMKTVEADNYFSRLVKYIPTEIIAIYLTLHSVLLTGGTGDRLAYLAWAIVGFGALCTYFYLQRVQKVTKQAQLIISCGAFLVWAFTLGGPGFEWFKPLYGALLLPAYTFFVGIFDA